MSLIGGHRQDTLSFSPQIKGVSTPYSPFLLVILSYALPSLFLPAQLMQRLSLRAAIKRAF